MRVNIPTPHQTSLVQVDKDLDEVSVVFPDDCWRNMSVGQEITVKVVGLRFVRTVGQANG